MTVCEIVCKYRQCKRNKKKKKKTLSEFSIFSLFCHNPNPPFILFIVHSFMRGIYILEGGSVYIYNKIPL